MKIVRFLGGLGNQMFQYAFYKALETKKIKVFADLQMFEGYTLHNGYELERIFNIKVQKPVNFYLELLKPNQRKWIFRKLKRILSLKRSYKEELIYFNFDSTFLNKKGHHYYWGYWQNAQYFDDIRQIILEDFTFPPPKGDQNIATLAEMKNQQSVSLHIRRGDYLKDEALGNICDLDYYLKAIEYINQKMENPFFYVFSDDIPWCEKNINPENVKYVNWNTGSNSYIDMQLMSNCKHNIIANSSFSWWGAWLNQNPHKIVIAPAKWMKNTTLTLALKEWIKF